MATLILGAAGAAVGGALFGPLGAVAGRALGALGGAVLDQTLLTPGRHAEGPRLDDLGSMTSTDGASMPRVYGRARLAGQVIWAAPVEEVIATQTQSSGGKSSGMGGGSTSTTYSYYGRFAVGICEGRVNRIGRIWADGQELDRQGLDIRVHLGGEDELPDPMIEAFEGAGNAPAYRGLAYIAFERLALAPYGNRLPQISVEVERAIGELETRLTAVTLIPGSSEFAYDPREVTRLEGPGAYAPENRHVTFAASDLDASLDQLLACCPNLQHVALVVSWFGTDLRAGNCLIQPGVERRVKANRLGVLPIDWAVAGQTRADAYLVTQYDGKPAYGGTPSDDSVRRAIEALKARGLKVTLYPFVMMDIAAGNTLPDPWSEAGAQPAYPWRGRITCHPAPGRPGSPDATAAAAAQVNALFGSAAPGHFTVTSGQVLYSGPEEWTLRRMVLHYATLAVAAGGVEAMLIGSEMAALTRVRSGAGSYPAVSALTALAADVKSVVGAGTRVSYAADWTEYGAHVMEGGAHVRFPLDPLWASPAIDFIGIDWYAPLADWRDGDAHLDAQLYESGYDRAYLAGNVNGGDGYDWFYPDEAARAAQARSPITDGAYGEPWVFRVKDLASWWGNAHHERIGGVRQVAPTAYVPGSKPMRLTEIGCAAVDKGANRPSVFPDPKSVESGLPPFSNGQRDDLMQRRHLEAMLDAFHSDGVNPVHGGLPGGRMVDPATLYAWTWDARPFPAFPRAEAVWADGANWRTGHWLTGRLGAAPLSELCARLAADFGVTDIDCAGLTGVIEGYVVDRPTSARGALEPLARAFGFALAERGGGLALRMRGAGTAIAIGDDDLVAVEGQPALGRVRAGDAELPLSVTLGFIEAAGDYRRATAGSRRLAGTARAEATLDLAMVADTGLAAGLAEMYLQDAWASRESASFALAPSRLALEPGDLVRLTRDGRERLMEITGIEDAEARAVSARSIDPGVFRLAAREGHAAPLPLPQSSGPPELVALALPTLPDGDPAAPPLGWLAAFARPWPGAMTLWRSLSGASFEAVASLAAPATLGRTLEALAPDEVWRWRRGVSLDVALNGGVLAGLSEIDVLGGANTLALVAPDGAAEIVQFLDAALIGANSWRLGGLLRGQLGTEAMARDVWPAGTTLVRLDRNLAPIAAGLDPLGRSVTLRVGRSDRGHGDAGVTEVSTRLTARALLPLAPVHARARRGAGGVTLSWIRRTRSGGDSWDLAEVPLNEASERYRLDILSGGAVVRSFETTMPSQLYASAQETADFGGPQAALDIRVVQLSASVGAGAPLDAHLTL
ncbi:baseplate multidomain protein megatron [Ancylobacter sp. G4_0304]|uniref:baseplate multidomain protein megatron n=1 Tax=Ancylobacter sp. G4_0304 TaxID=3114289 RepID=UPI0039C5AEEC